MNDHSPKAAPTRVFLSYARGDDEAFVRRLHADLTKAAFTVWFGRATGGEEACLPIAFGRRAEVISNQWSVSSDR